MCYRVDANENRTENTGDQVSENLAATHGTPFTETLPPHGVTVSLNTECEYKDQGCTSTQFCCLGKGVIICAGCERVQHLTPDRGAHYWATRKWAPLSA